MTELDFYVFIITENEYEWHTHNGEVFIYPYYFQMENFCNFIKDYVTDNVIDAKLYPSCIGIPMDDICSYYGVNVSDIFRTTDSQY